jgi:hypothetical protein
MVTKKAALITSSFFIIGGIVGFGFAEPYVNCVWRDKPNAQDLVLMRSSRA